MPAPNFRPSGHRIDGTLERDTEKAYLVRPFDGRPSVWLPKRFTHQTSTRTYYIPSWLAREKGLTAPLVRQDRDINEDLR